MPELQLRGRGGPNQDGDGQAGHEDFGQLHRAVQRAFSFVEASSFLLSEFDACDPGQNMGLVPVGFC